MMTWHRGSEIVNANRTRQEGPLREFVAELHAHAAAAPTGPRHGRLPQPVQRHHAAGAASERRAQPRAARARRDPHLPVREQSRACTTHDRVTVDGLGFDDDDIAHVTARFGFQEQPNVPLALRLAIAKGLECDIDADGPTYFLSRTIRITDATGMAGWRKRLFAVGHDVADAVDYFGLPLERTILVGSQIPLSSAAARPALVCFDGSDRAEGALRCVRALLRPRPEVVVHVSRRRAAAAALEEAHRRDACVIVVEAYGRAASWPGSLIGALLRHIEGSLCSSVLPAAYARPRADPRPATTASRAARKALIAAGGLLAGRAAIVATFMPAVDDLAVLRTSLPWPASAETQERLAAARSPGGRGPGRAGARGRPDRQSGPALRCVPWGSRRRAPPARKRASPGGACSGAAGEEAAACIVVGHRPSANGRADTAHALIDAADRPVLVVPEATL